jgi:hypothetical protein
MPGDAVSAVPMEIASGSDELSLRIELTQPGNSFLEALQKGASTRK